jgi:hypothetical protein
MLFFIAILVLTSGCSELESFAMTKKLEKEQDVQYRYLSIKTADGRVSFEVVAPYEYAFNAVVINPGNVIADALYKEISAIAPKLTAPRETTSAASRPESEQAEYMLVLMFEKSKKHDGYVLITNAGSARRIEWREKALEARTYHREIAVNFSCAGDMPQTCSRKLADAAIEGSMPVVKRFVKDLGY